MAALAILVGLLAVIGRCSGQILVIDNFNPESKKTAHLVAVDGIQYQLIYNRVTWAEARVKCEEKKGSVAVFETQRKQNAVAMALSENNPDGEDWWIGATFKNTTHQWTWFFTKEPKDGMNFSLPKTPVGPRPNVQPFAHCVALDSHGCFAELLYINLPCETKRAFICQMPGLDFSLSPRPILPPIFSKKDSSFILLYASSFTWEQAEAFCYQIGQQLAVITSLDIMQKLSEKTSLARPEVTGNIWLGVRKHGKRWIYYSRYFDRQEANTNYSCVALDVNSSKSPLVVDSDCNKTNNFACQTVSEDPVSSGGQQVDRKWARVIKNESVYMSLTPLPWAAAARMCASNGGHLLHLNNLTKGVSLEHLTERVSFAMIHASIVVKNIWLGGRMVNNNVNTSGAKKWAWVKKDTPPFQGDPMFNLLDLRSWVDVCKSEYESEDYPCLNLECEINSEMAVYGIKCEYPQYFICQGINIKPEPTVTVEDLEDDVLNTMFYQPKKSSGDIVSTAGLTKKTATITKTTRFAKTTETQELGLVIFG